MLLNEIAEASADVAATSSRLAKVSRLAAALEQASPEEVPIAVAYLSGRTAAGDDRRRLGGASASLPKPAGAAAHDRAPRSGRSRVEDRRASPGPARRRRGATRSQRSSARATEVEQRFLVGLFLGELRQGALAGVMVEAVARAANLPAAQVRRAVMLAGELGACGRRRDRRGRGRA